MMGLYSDSPSAVSIVTHSTETRDRVDSQLRSVARGMMLHPSPWGAHVAHTILSDPKLYPAWWVHYRAFGVAVLDTADQGSQAQRDQSDV